MVQSGFVWTLDCDWLFAGVVLVVAVVEYVKVAVSFGSGSTRSRREPEFPRHNHNYPYSSYPPTLRLGRWEESRLRGLLQLGGALVVRTTGQFGPEVTDHQLFCPLGVSSPSSQACKQTNKQTDIIESENRNETLAPCRCANSTEQVSTCSGLAGGKGKRNKCRVISETKVTLLVSFYLCWLVFQHLDQVCA